MKYRYILGLLVLVTISGIFIFGGDDTPKTDAAVSALTVTVITPEEHTLQEQVQLTGVIVPRETLLVSTELPNVRVKRVLADVGDYVRKGQALALLDTDSLTNVMHQLQSDYDQAQDAYQRVAGIQETGAVSKESVVQKRAAMLSAKARLDDAALNLKRSTLTAPDVGLIIERTATIGEVVTPNTPLYRIAWRGEMELEASVPEGSLAKLAPKMPAVISVTGEAEPLQGTIRLLTPQVTNTTRTATLRISVNSTRPLTSGIFAEASITTQEKQGLTLPTTALQQDGEATYVWQLDEENKASRHPVTVVLLDESTALVNGVEQDARIIARAGAFIKEGEIVRVAESTEEK
jgi:HlyD family secretion protein